MMWRFTVAVIGSNRGYFEIRKPNMHSDVGREQGRSKDQQCGAGNGG
jgi:hypothetical protein